MPKYCSEYRKLIPSSQDDPERLDFDTCSCTKPLNILPLQRAKNSANVVGNDKNESSETLQVRRKDSEGERDQAFALNTQAEMLITKMMMACPSWPKLC